MGKHKCSKCSEKSRKECFHTIKTKYVCSKCIKSEQIDSKTITSEEINTVNINVSTINDQLFEVSSSTLSPIISGLITPVTYVNGEAQKPENNQNIEQHLFDDLWVFVQLGKSLTDLDSAYGRLRTVILNNFYNCSVCPEIFLEDCECPVPSYATFQASIQGNLLTVTSMLDTSYVPDCPPNVGTIQIGQRIYSSSQSILDSTIVNQVSGTTGGVGVYTIRNNFEDYSKNYPSSVFLSLSDSGSEECGNVPLRIYGVETVPIFSENYEQNVNSISYDINIANKTLGAKLAAVFVQVGYINNAGEVQIQGLSINTKQFDNSILSFGEQMNNTVTMSSDLTQEIILQSLSSTTVNAVIQLAVFIEDGLEVYLPTSDSSRISRSVSSRQVTESENYTAFSISSDCILDITSSNWNSTFTQRAVGKDFSVQNFEIEPPGLYIVDPFGQVVAILYNNFFVTPAGNYIFSRSSPSNYKVLRISETPDYPTGSTVGPFQKLKSIGIFTEAIQPVRFTQPQVGQDVTIPFRSKRPNSLDCLMGKTVYLAEQQKAFKVGYYRVAAIGPETYNESRRRHQRNVTLTNLGGPANLGSGFVVDPTVYQLVDMYIIN